MTGCFGSTSSGRLKPNRRRLAALALKVLRTGTIALAFLAPPATFAQERASPSAVRTLAYSCDGLDFTVQRASGEIALYLPDRYVVLSRLPATGEEKYQQGDIVFRIQGADASLERDGQSFAHCRINPARSTWEDARLRGVDFRAVGNAPDWSLELSPAHQIVFLTDAGRRRVDVTAIEPIVNGPASTYHAKAIDHDLMLVLETGNCRNAETDEALDIRVSVQLDQEAYRGCGRWLRATNHGY